MLIELPGFLASQTSSNIGGNIISLASGAGTLVAHTHIKRQHITRAPGGRAQKILANRRVDSIK